MPTARFFLSAFLTIAALAMVGYASGSVVRGLALLREGYRAEAARQLLAAAAMGLIGIFVLISLGLRLLKELGLA